MSYRTDASIPPLARHMLAYAAATYRRFWPLLLAVLGALTAVRLLVTGDWPEWWRWVGAGLMIAVIAPTIRWGHGRMIPQIRQTPAPPEIDEARRAYRAGTLYRSEAIERIRALVSVTRLGAEDMLDRRESAVDREPSSKKDPTPPGGTT